MVSLEEFIDFHRHNAALWQAFEKLGMLVFSNRRRFSARVLWDRIRWDAIYSRKRDLDDEDYYLNDKWCTPYSRLFIAVHPEVGDFF